MSRSTSQNINNKKTTTINNFAKNILIETLNHIGGAAYKRGRPRETSNETYIEAIFYVLKTGIGWEYLQGFGVKGDTVRKKFNNWNKLNLFKMCWGLIINIYQEFKVDFSNLYIDASHIKNYYGTETIGPNHYDRFKTATKLSMITDDIGVPVGIKMAQCNIADIKLLFDTFNAIPLNIDSTENLIADKGYIGKEYEKELMSKHKVKLITPEKRSKNKKDSKPKEKPGRPTNEKVLLKTRFINEQSFSWIKKYKRLLIRFDKKIKQFEGFIYLGALNIAIEKLIDNLSCI